MNSIEENEYYVRKNEDRVRKLAHQYWIEDGKPNGEEYRDTRYGKMKIKDIHWNRAKDNIEAAYNHNAGGDW